MLLKLLAVLSVAGCGIWIGRQPKETEPYVTLLGTFSGLLLLIRDRKAPHIVASIQYRDGWSYFRLDNRGDATAFDVDVAFPDEPQRPKMSPDVPRLEHLLATQTFEVGFEHPRDSKTPYAVEVSWARKKGGRRASQRTIVLQEIVSLPLAPAPTISPPIDIFSRRSIRR
jgi:hypothetical protein